jgi:phosphate-selective porin OprO/OprP
MKASLHAAAIALLGGLASANTPNSDPPDDGNLPLAEENQTEEGESAGLIPSTYKTLFKNDNIDMTWGGRTYFDLGFFSADPSYVDDSGGIAGDGAEFRTVRFFAKGTIYNSVDFKTQIQFEGGGGNKFKDVYIGMKTPIGKVRVGHFKEPFSIEKLTSSRFITFMERSLGDVFAPGRNIGLQVSDYVEELHNFNWAVGIFRDSKDGQLSQGEGQYSVTGRLCGTIFNNADFSHVLHLGSALSLRSDTMGMTDLTEEPEIHLLADLGGAMIPSEGALHWNLGTAWVNGPISAQAEFFMTSVDGGTSGVDADYTGGYLFGSYFLTGEQRNYKANGGRFDRIKMTDSLDGSGGSGAIELKARISMNDFNDGPTDNEINNYSAGVNWYLNPNTRIMFDYIHSEYQSGATDDSLDGLMIRFQIDF